MKPKTYTRLLNRVSGRWTNELSQRSPTGGQIRPLCRVSRGAWIRSQSPSRADLVTSRHRGPGAYCGHGSPEGQGAFQNTEGTDHPDGRSRPASHVLRYLTFRDFVFPWQVGGSTRPALDRLPSRWPLGSRRGFIRFLSKIEPPGAFGAFGGYRSTTRMWPRRQVDPGGRPSNRSGPFPLYAFRGPGSRAGL